MQTSTAKKIFLTFILSAIAVTGSLYFYQTHIAAQGPIYNFDEERDTQPILDLFKTDYYWLVEGEFNAAAMLHYQAPNGNPFKKGQMYIKVLRENNEFIGFVTYYKKSPTEWKLNFIAVDSKFRGKGYAQKLMQYALDDMKRMGAKKITLVTRTSNLSAQKLYNRSGFKETYRDEGYVYFQYDGA